MHVLAAKKRRGSGHAARCGLIIARPPAPRVLARNRRFALSGRFALSAASLRASASPFRAPAVPSHLNPSLVAVTASAAAASARAASQRGRRSPPLLRKRNASQMRRRCASRDTVLDPAKHIVIRLPV